MSKETAQAAVNYGREPQGKINLDKGSVLPTSHVLAPMPIVQQPKPSASQTATPKAEKK